MDSIILSVLETENSTRKECTKCVSLSFVKERYTPYSFFRGSFIVDESFDEIYDVELYVNGHFIHKGLVDTIEIKKLYGYKMLTISSRGYSMALGLNELEPGMKYGVNLEALLSDGISLPNIYYQSGTKTVNYIYIKEHSSLWDAVVSTCLKSENDYPYIKNVNTVQFNKHSNPLTINLSSNDKILSISEGSDISKLISNIHMRDTNGTYNSFNIESQYAVERNAIRHKHCAFNDTWLSNINTGLEHGIKWGMRGCKFKSVAYHGYRGEDINDLINLSDFDVDLQNKYISRLEITANKKGISTRLFAYEDGYCNI